MKWLDNSAIALCKHSVILTLTGKNKTEKERFNQDSSL